MGYSMFSARGLTHADPVRSFSGYLIFATLSGDSVYLVDNRGATVRTWQPPTGLKPFGDEIRENGNLFLHCTDGTERWEVLQPETANRVQGGEASAAYPDGTIIGDFLREVDLDGKTVWEWHANDHRDFAHEQICPLDGRREWTHCNSVEELPTETSS